MNRWNVASKKIPFPIYATKYFMNLCWNGKFGCIRDGWWCCEIPFIDQFVRWFLYLLLFFKCFYRPSKMTRMSTCIWIHLSHRVFDIAYIVGSFEFSDSISLPRKQSTVLLFLGYLESSIWFQNDNDSTLKATQISVFLLWYKMYCMYT